MSALFPEVNMLGAMEPNEAVLVFVSGLAAGVTNAIAGGGTFFTFPAFLSIGLQPVTANACNAIAVWPGHAAAVPVYFRRLRGIGGSLVLHCLVALAGGIVGATLALASGNVVFEFLIPWLTLLATLLFGFGVRIRTLLPTRDHTAFGPVAFSVEFVFCVYGGYFGAGLGVLLMACLAMLGHDELQTANALKNLLATIITSVASLTFILSGAVHWPPTLFALAGALVGGVLGARFARRLSESWLRRVVIAVGTLLTLHFFWRVYR